MTVVPSPSQFYVFTLRVLGDAGSQNRTGPGVRLAELHVRPAPVAPSDVSSCPISPLCLPPPAPFPSGRPHLGLCLWPYMRLGSFCSIPSPFFSSFSCVDTGLSASPCKYLFYFSFAFPILYILLRFTGKP